MSWIRTWRALRSKGVLGINRRNAEYTLRWNRRSRYPTVDDKMLTKKLCAGAGIPTPALLAVASHHFELRKLRETVRHLDSFVLKPARGAMGNGILVVRERQGDRFRLAGGRWIGLDDLSYHAAGIISGLYALAGQADVAIVEERLEVHPELAEIATEGVPDVRVIVFRGVPTMAMTRLPTRKSSGRANLHQGAVAAGIDLGTGATTHAVQESRLITHHPDTGQGLLNRVMPGWPSMLGFAVRAADESGLGYVGADMVVDATRGPVLLEMNARPGLMIQLANQAGLVPRLRAIERDWRPDRSVEERTAAGVAIAAGATT